MSVDQAFTMNFQELGLALVSSLTMIVKSCPVAYTECEYPYLQALNLSGKPRRLVKLPPDSSSEFTNYTQVHQQSMLHVHVQL